MKVDKLKKWGELPQNTLGWMKDLGDFSITAKGDEVKGTSLDENGEPTRTYYNAADLRGLAQAALEVARLLDDGHQVLHLDEAALLVDKELPGWLWSFAIIRNVHHSLPPYGVGVGVTLRSPDNAEIWEKSAGSALEATRKAIQRASAIDHVKLEAELDRSCGDARLDALHREKVLKEVFPAAVVDCGCGMGADCMRATREVADGKD